MDLSKLSSKELYALFGPAPKNKKGREISPHIWMTEEQFKLYRNVSKKEQKKIKMQDRESALAYCRSLSDRELLGICDGCNKSCPCNWGIFRLTVMKERGLV